MCTAVMNYCKTELYPIEKSEQGRMEQIKDAMLNDGMDILQGDSELFYTTTGLCKCLYETVKANTRMQIINK